MKSFLFAVGAAVGAVLLGIIFKGKAKADGKHFFQRLLDKVKPKPDPEQEPPRAPIVVKDTSPCVILTCFELDQPTFLQHLNLLNPTGRVAFDTVVRFSVDSKRVYLTPALLEPHASLTWTLLSSAETAEIAEVPIDVESEDEPETRSLLFTQAQADIAEATCYFGIDMAIMPLTDSYRSRVRTTLQRLQETLGARLCVYWLQKDVLESWAEDAQKRRLAIWDEILDGLDVCIREDS